MEGNNNFPIDISLQLSFERKFYSYSYNVYTIINGKTHRSELNKTLHVTLQKTENGRFEFHIETFDREHRDKELSLSEKDFLGYIAKINDEIKVVTDKYAKLKTLKDLPVLQDKAKEIVKKLSGSYVGIHAVNSFKFLKAFYNNGNMVCDDLLKNNQFGLILHKFYGKYDTVLDHSINRPGYVKDSILHENCTCAIIDLKKIKIISQIQEDCDGS